MSSDGDQFRLRTVLGCGDVKDDYCASSQTAEEFCSAAGGDDDGGFADGQDVFHGLVGVNHCLF